MGRAWGSGYHQKDYFFNPSLTWFIKKILWIALYEVMEVTLLFILDTKCSLRDIWLLRYKQNSFGYIHKKTISIFQKFMEIWKNYPNFGCTVNPPEYFSTFFILFSTLLGFYLSGTYFVSYFLRFFFDLGNKLLPSFETNHVYVSVKKYKID